MHLARSIRVLTTVLLLCAGLCEWKSNYLLVCVALRYTPTSILSSSLTVLLVSREAMLFLPIVVVGPLLTEYWRLSSLSGYEKLQHHPFKCMRSSRRRSDATTSV